MRNVKGNNNPKSKKNNPRGNDLNDTRLSKVATARLPVVAGMLVASCLPSFVGCATTKHHNTGLLGGQNVTQEMTQKIEQASLEQEKLIRGNGRSIEGEILRREFGYDFDISSRCVKVGRVRGQETASKISHKLKHRHLGALLVSAMGAEQDGIEEGQQRGEECGKLASFLTETAIRLIENPKNIFYTQDVEPSGIDKAVNIITEDLNYAKSCYDETPSTRALIENSQRLLEEINFFRTRNIYDRQLRFQIAEHLVLHGILFGTHEMEQACVRAGCEELIGEIPQDEWLLQVRGKIAELGKKSSGALVVEEEEKSWGLFNNL